MSKGALAMAVAMAHPDPEKGGRGQKAKNSKETLVFSIMLLSQARLVLRVTPTIAQSVIAGRVNLQGRGTARVQCEVVFELAEQRFRIVSAPVAPFAVQGLWSRFESAIICRGARD
jgi:hypothetical protein